MGITDMVVDLSKRFNAKAPYAFPCGVFSAVGGVSFLIAGNAAGTDCLRCTGQHILLRGGYRRVAIAGFSVGCDCVDDFVLAEGGRADGRRIAMHFGDVKNTFTNKIPYLMEQERKAFTQANQILLQAEGVALYYQSAALSSNTRHLLLPHNRFIHICAISIV